jgi:hypothetical protein
MSVPRYIRAENIEILWNPTSAFNVSSLQKFHLIHDFETPVWTFNPIGHLIRSDIFPQLGPNYINFTNHIHSPARYFFVFMYFWFFRTLNYTYIYICIYIHIFIYVYIYIYNYIYYCHYRLASKALYIVDKRGSFLSRLHRVGYQYPYWYIYIFIYLHIHIYMYIVYVYMYLYINF